MRQYYKPMLANSAAAPFTSRDWIFEIKWDGIRAISYVDNELSVRSRNGKEMKDKFPELEELKSVAMNTVLDGEIVVMQEKRPDFQTLLERSRATSIRDAQYIASSVPVTYVVFDILEKDGERLASLPLVERKRILRERVKDGKYVVLSVFVEEDGDTYYKEAIKRGVEGIVAKKKDSPYESGVRSKNWLKVKKVQTCDCVIFGYTKGEGFREGTFGALILGLYDNKTPVFVGKVGTGFSDSTMRTLLEAFEELKAGKETLAGVDVQEEITWLKPELVCEVAYQNLTKEGKLRMPRFHGLRPDKIPTECTLDQVKQSGLSDTAQRETSPSHRSQKVSQRLPAVEPSSYRNTMQEDSTMTCD